MNCRKNLVLIALGALVAGAAALVYAHNEAGQAAPPEARSAGAQTSTGAIQAPGKAPEPLYDFNALPDPVKRMLEQIAAAAQSGEIENMRPVFESNELKPMVTTAYVEDPIGFWTKASPDGTGRDVLAAMLNVMASGYARVGEGQDEIFVWPYFAETDLAKLTPAQEVELYRIVPPAQALTMKKAGKYSYYRLGISPNGVWQYFLQ
jgi:hypothetical protein